MLSQSGPDGPVSHPLDLAFLARLRDRWRRRLLAFDDFDYAGALDTRALLLVRLHRHLPRAGEGAGALRVGPRGSRLGGAALQLGLSVLLRLFAPFVPYITEEVWSWGFAQASGARSIHRAPWPSAAEFAAVPAGEAGAGFDAACAFLDAVRRAKSAAGATVGRQLARLRVATSPRTFDLLAPSLADLASAARAEGDVLEAREGMEDGAFEVTEIVLAEKPPKTTEP